MIETTCLACGQTDDHPKHQAVIDALHTSVFFHMDCHAQADPPCAVCAAQRAGAEDLRGQDLRDHIVENTPSAVVMEGESDAV